MTYAGSMSDDGNHLLREFLNAHEATCPRCGYNLHGLTSVNCPECGERLSLTVHAPRRQAAWICGLIALSASAGFSALLSLVGIYFLIIGNAFDRDPFYGFGAGFVISSLLIVAWISQRPRLQRASGVKRWLWALAASCVPLANVIIMVATTYR